jgi:hypothetical protein
MPHRLRLPPAAVDVARVPARVARRVALVAIFAVPALCAAQSNAKPELVESFRAGPFEFPMSGEFTVERDGGATVLTTVDQTRRFTLGYFANTSADAGNKSEQLATLEALIKGNWERFAAKEKGRIVRAFQRADRPSGLSIFSMASEFGAGDERQYYVQFAVSDGPRFATVFAEGDGDAKPILELLEPLVMQARVSGN